jgi:hypothetical protein
MYIPPKALSEHTLPPEILRADRKCCAEYEDFGLGDEALYVEYFACSRMGYIPLSAIERVYKRLAISKSYYKGNLFGTLCYLVVRYDGKEKAFRFTHEENLDAILEDFRKRTKIPVGKV